MIAGKNIIANISTRLVDDRLVIENNNKCNFVRGYKHRIRINITLPYIKMVTNMGVAALRFADDYTQDTLVVRNTNSGDIYVNGSYGQLRTSTNGNGDMYLKGTAQSFFVYTNGTNYIHAKELSVKDYAFIHSSTMGECYINAEGMTTFAYHIQSSGNIHYFGTPANIVNYGPDESKGQLIKE